jgi:hypothetical protein
VWRAKLVELIRETEGESEIYFRELAKLYKHKLELYKTEAILKEIINLREKYVILFGNSRILNRFLRSLVRGAFMVTDRFEEAYNLYSVEE